MKRYYCNGKKDFCDRDCKSDACEFFDGSGGEDMEVPLNKEFLWQFNLEQLKNGIFGPKNELTTTLRYWKAQEDAGYPSASENVKYFTDIVEKGQRERGQDCLRNTLLYIRDYLIAIIDEWYRRQDEPNFYEQNIMVYNHVRKELDDLSSLAEKFGVNLDGEEDKP